MPPMVMPAPPVTRRSISDIRPRRYQCCHRHSHGLFDSIPMVIISGQVSLPVIGSDAFQEVDMVGITRPCVKHNFLVKDVTQLAETIKKAFYIATTGRPGPVVIDVPKDITAPHIKVPYKYPKKVSIPRTTRSLPGIKGKSKKAVELLLSAQKPIIYSGGGVVLGEASKELTEFTRTTGLSDYQYLNGLRLFPGIGSAFCRHAGHARHL